MAALKVSKSLGRNDDYIIFFCLKCSHQESLTGFQNFFFCIGCRLIPRIFKVQSGKTTVWPDQQLRDGLFCPFSLKIEFRRKAQILGIPSILVGSSLHKSGALNQPQISVEDPPR